ncbi:MAG: hypothetical protein AAFV80_06255, partial [Bacteroidota bacterium]
MIPSIPGLFQEDFKVYEDAFLYQTDAKLEPLALLVEDHRTTRIRIRKSRLPHLNFLTDYPDLDALDLSKTTVGNWEESIFRSLPNLRQLVVPQTGFQAAVRLSSMKMLDSLDLSGNALDRIPKLPASLTWLDLSNNAIDDFLPLGTLKKLNTLLADGFQGKHLNGLEHLINLKAIQMDNSPKLAELGALTNLNLRQISFAKCNIKGIQVFAGHQELDYMDLTHNWVSD